MKIFRLFIITNLALLLIFVFPVYAQDTTGSSSDVHCLAKSATPCRFLETNVRGGLLKFALDNGSISPEQIHVAYGKGAWRRAYIARIESTDFPNTEFGLAPRIFVPSNEYVGIPELGVLIQKDTMRIWQVETVTVASNARNHVFVHVPSIKNPLVLKTDNVVGRSFTSYYWYSSNMLLIYSWLLTKQGNELVFEIENVTIEYISPAQSITDKKSETEITSIEDISLKRGDAIEVVDIDSDSSYWDVPSVSSWKIMDRRLNYIVFKKGNVYGTLGPDVVSGPVFEIYNYRLLDECNRPYWPHVGEILYARETMYYPTVSPMRPGRTNLSESELKALDKFKADPNVLAVKGKIIREDAIQSTSTDVFVIKTASQEYTFYAYEWQVPPKESSVTAYLMPDTLPWLVALQNSNGEWWYVQTSKEPKGFLCE
jgi:hypothetical protein